jgi:hypothetical protein
MAGRVTVFEWRGNSGAGLAVLEDNDDVTVNLSYREITRVSNVQPSAASRVEELYVWPTISRSRFLIALPCPARHQLPYRRARRRLCVPPAPRVERAVQVLLSLFATHTAQLYSNTIKTLPSAIGRLTALECLNLTNNRLECLPRELGLLTVLEELMLGDNRLVAVPAELGKLPLTELWLRRNRLCWLPLELDGLAATAIVTVRLHRVFNRRLTRGCSSTATLSRSPISKATRVLVCASCLPGQRTSA